MKLLACLHQVVCNVEVVDLVGEPLTQGLEVTPASDSMVASSMT